MYFCRSENVGKIIAKNVITNLSNKFSQKRLDHSKQLARYVPHTASKRVIQKAAESTGDLIGNKIANSNTKD